MLKIPGVRAHAKGMRLARPQRDGGRASLHDELLAEGVVTAAIPMKYHNRYLCQILRSVMSPSYLAKALGDGFCTSRAKEVGNHSLMLNDPRSYRERSW